MQSSSTPDEQRIEHAARGFLRGIGRLSQSLFRIGDFGLSRSHTTVLDALEGRSRRVTELAGLTGLAQPRVTVVLKELEERGLVECAPCPLDRRAKETHITPAGHALLEQGRQRMAVALLEGLSATVDDPERAVALARDSVTTLLHAIEPEVS
ncbi:MarR family winged helix-turn-helix transcriptional regulator [Streptomyces sp. NPDC059740]|uniref:MarR family winged helix-turn-helix transcriptional regulator n=1 Tax=Streptomyces sp. NPDC059740 TaxID=3346926 RepID=UPI003651C486